MKIAESTLKHIIKEEIKAIAESAIDNPIVKASPEAQEYLKKLEGILKRNKGNIPKKPDLNVAGVFDPNAKQGYPRFSPGENSSFTKADGIPLNNLFYTLNGAIPRQRIIKHIDETIAEMTALLRLLPSFISGNDLEDRIKTTMEKNIKELQKVKNQMEQQLPGS